MKRPLRSSLFVIRLNYTARHGAIIFGDNKIGNEPRISTPFDLNIQNVTFPTVKIFAGVSHRDIALVARVACLEILAFCNIDSVLAAYISICVIRGC